jgi:RHS repeat-associated protein
VAGSTYDAAGQISGATYDGEGRLTSSAGRTYKWDLASRLTSYSGPGGEASFTYDAFGMRISRTSAGRTQRYVLNYGTVLATVAAVREAGADVRYYIYLPDGGLLYSIDAANGSRRFYHYDEAGSTLFLTDDAGGITDSYGITPFGEDVARSGATDNPFTYLGAQGVMQEGSTGLYYMRMRYYDSASARFLSRDPQPVFDLRSVNLYQYALQNPLSFIDPMGRGGTAGPQVNLAERGDFSRFVLSLPGRLAPGAKPAGPLPPLLQALLDAMQVNGGVGGGGR